MVEIGAEMAEWEIFMSRKMTEGISLTAWISGGFFKENRVKCRGDDVMVSSVTPKNPLVKIDVKIVKICQLMAAQMSSISRPGCLDGFSLQACLLECAQCPDLAA